jgi:transposase
MVKPKYPLETRLVVVNHYLAGKDGTHRKSERFGIEKISTTQGTTSLTLKVGV